MIINDLEWLKWVLFGSGGAKNLPQLELGHLSRITFSQLVEESTEKGKQIHQLIIQGLLTQYKHHSSSEKD